MTRITETFERCSSRDRAAFVAYITAGDPDYTSSLRIANAMVLAGIDILELGVPFSDPLADGEANQLAAERAISSGMTAHKVLDEAREIRRRHPAIPIVLFTYMNPIAYSGNFKSFCKKAVASGVDAILPLDLPPEEDAALRKTIEDSGLSTVGLIAPNTPKNRIPLLCKNASAFIYYVSREGVTGEGKDFSANFAGTISEIKKHTDLPVVVGFGISTPKHVKAAAATGVDGVVVGSAIVRRIESMSKGIETMGSFKAFIRKMCDAANK
ncbi:MAG TPA: tryptophan synthase subunit alpha [Lentisphaeria bacterium]|nr:MAG: tryptophan synthase subunit alpha [Lentisphaerae bacterium GWF2_49_21]HBC85357.1 tryptophan synthase subunit alpha [Lentisphaeria bacterium]